MPLETSGIVSSGLASPNLVTQGLGDTVFIIIDDRVRPQRYGSLKLDQARDEGLIQTRKIIVRDTDREIEVEALLIHSADLPYVKAELLRIGYPETRIEVRYEQGPGE